MSLRVEVRDQQMPHFFQTKKKNYELNVKYPPEI
jgi:hypothetical protein